VLNTAQGCRTLLLELYNLSQKSRKDQQMLFPEQVSAVLQVVLKDTIPIIDYLEKSGYIKCGRPIDRPYSWVKLSQPGMELVKDTSAFDKEFPTYNSAATTSSYRSGVNAFEYTAPPAQPQAEQNEVNFTNIQFTSINPSLVSIVQSIRQGDDQPLREFLSILILQGGVNTTIGGVKALLAAYQNETS
jgi:hypothetical protein